MIGKAFATVAHRLTVILACFSNAVLRVLTFDSLSLLVVLLILAISRAISFVYTA